MPLFLGIVLSVALLTLPNYSPGVTDLVFFISAGLIFFLPFAFSAKISSSASLFFDNNHPLGRKLLSFHGVAFLAIFQPFALLWAIDYFLPPFFSEAHNVALIGITVLGGLLAIAVSPRWIRHISRMVSSILLGGVLLVAVNAAVFRLPLFPFDGSALLTIAEQSVSGSFLSVNAVIAIAALSIILFWLTWLEMSEVDRKQGMKGESTVIYSVTGALFFIAGVSVLGMLKYFNADQSGAAGVNAAGMLISAGLIAALTGLFVVTIASVGSLYAYRLYPQFSGAVDKEKQALANKLAVVFSVIVAVLLIPIERNASGNVILWYIGFLAMFTAPIVTAFIISMLVKKQRPFVLSFSIALGGLSAAIDFVVTSALAPAMIESSNMFSLSIVGASVTAASYAVLVAMKELVVVQRVLSRMDHS
ncbi:MAG: hypothetical protein KA247_00940 [Bacteroidetes bacterium]|nr:hypothetical protein [Bacteroidota bacterium]